MSVNMESDSDFDNIPKDSISSKSGIYGLFSSVVGDVRADKLSHDYKRVKKHISTGWEKKAYTEEKRKERRKHSFEMKVQELSL